MSKKVRKKVNKIIKKQLTGVSLFFAVLFLIMGIVIGFYLYNINNKEGFSKIELNGNGIVNLKVGDNYYTQHNLGKLFFDRILDEKM